MNIAHKRFFTAQDYLAWEQEQDIKHEYIRGEVYAMAGARDAHVIVSLNIATLLKTHARGTPCRTYIADMKLRVESTDAFFYPDVFVTCDVGDRESDVFKSHPTLIVEVLSESTAGFDRGKKFGCYRMLETLKEYVLIDPDLRTVDVFRLNGGGHWVLYPFEGDSEVEFASLEFRVPLAAVFEDVLPPAQDGAESGA